MAGLASQWKVSYYTESKGGCPVKEFIDSLPSGEQARILARIGLLEEKGIYLHRPYADLLEDGIHELRVKVSKLRYRVLYFFWERKKIVLTHGFTKVTRRTPKSEIKRAKVYRDDWIAHHGGGK